MGVIVQWTLKPPSARFRARRAFAACFARVFLSAFVIFPARTRDMSKDILLFDIEFPSTYIV